MRMFYKKAGRYIPTIEHKGKTLHLGGTSTPSECVKLRLKAISALQKMRGELKWITQI